ncbi:MAG: TolC family protein [Bacteroidaceae bacterium]|nr:TolC family protein [Bacteroidaceae bacterium]
MNFWKTTNTRKTFGLALMTFCSSLAYAQSRPVIELTLNKAIETALAENPTMQVAEKEIQLKQVADKEAWQALLPSLDATLALSHSIKVAEMRTSMGTFKMGMDGSTTAQGGITLTLPLFAPALYQNMKLTKEDILVAQEKARSSKLDLVNQVTKAYYAALLSKDSYDVVQKAYKTSEEYYKVISNMYEVGRVSEYDKISAEVQMRNMSASVVSTETGVKLSHLQLKVLMGITADVDIVIKDNLKSYESQMRIPAEVNGNELNNNTNLKQLDLNISLLERARKMLKTNFMPTVAMQLVGQYQSMSNPNWNVFNYHYSPSVSMAFSVSIPIFKASNWTKLQSNRIQISQLQDNRENARRQLSIAAASYRENMISTVAKLESNRQAVAQADKAVTISAKRYDVGKGTVLELNQSETALTQAELSYHQSIYEYLTNRADLEYTLGMDN